jgi:hypothetical protein
MLDSSTNLALSIKKAKKYSNRNNIPLLESNQLKKYVYQNVY